MPRSTVVGDRVLVASAFLDKEQLGDRALFCLDAKTGDIVWRKPLTINPWGGPSVVGKTVVVSGSTIGYDPKALKGAQRRAGRVRPGKRATRNGTRRSRAAWCPAPR